MKKLVIKPTDFPITLAECPPGHFILLEHLNDALVYLKTEYHLEPYYKDIMAFCDSGEYCHVDNETLVYPCEARWEEE